MLDAPGDNEGVVGGQLDSTFVVVVAVAQVDRQVAVDDDEHLVGVGVAVPDVFARDLGQAHFGVVDGGEGARAPEVIEGGEGICDVARRSRHDSTVALTSTGRECDE